jgi:HEAT repeat protein
LLDLFKKERDEQVRWALACALSATADDNVIVQVIELFLDKTYGEDRIAFIEPLSRSTTPEAAAALEQGRQDPQLPKEIRRQVGRPRKR